uniref:LRAT domain-containing protein n=2 Tax=Myotis myotis TaxID=51298 RepID=A0A7J7VKT2_MYOMY|nr:hypothetical protein mMyoMyo1_016294 [Myotis myotis]
MVGKEMEYSVLSRNCEHFVTDLRYGKARSLQVETIKTDLNKYLGNAAWTALTCSVMKKPLPNTSDSLKGQETSH